MRSLSHAINLRSLTVCGKNESTVSKGFPRTSKSGTSTQSSRVTSCLENLEMSGNLTAVREISGIILKVREKYCGGKVA